MMGLDKIDVHSLARLNQLQGANMRACFTCGISVYQLIKINQIHPLAMISHSLVRKKKKRKVFVHRIISNSGSRSSPQPAY